MIKLSKKDKDTIQKIHLLTGQTFSETREFYEGLLLNFVLSYLEKEPVVLPLFGEISIHYLGDDITSKGRKAKVDIDFTPHENLIRNIGQIEDGDECDLEVHLKERVFKTLDTRIEEVT